MDNACLLLQWLVDCGGVPILITLFLFSLQIGLFQVGTISGLDSQNPDAG